MKKDYLLYSAMLLFFAIGVYFVLKIGKRQEVIKNELEVVSIDRNSIQKNTNDKTERKESLKGFQSSTVGKILAQPFSLLLIQIIIIIVFSRLCGMMFRKIGQPMVIGEIIAGILLGPSFLGYLFPFSSEILFPKESLKILQFFSQIGLILFMFIIGMELDLDHLKKRTRAAIFTSHASVVVPFFLGTLVSIFIFEKFAPRNAYFSSFSLFMGIAMSVTAFPVLARIIQEKGLIKSNLGAMAITCAAVDDITAWCLLAIVVTIVQAKAILSALIVVTLSLFYVGVMVYFIRPLLTRMSAIYVSREILGKGVMAAVLVLLFISALFTEAIGIHALFGAFIAGVIMPTSTKFRRILADRIEDLSMTFLLPLFFVFTGLRTQFGLLNEPGNWLALFAILCAAVFGKFGGSSIAARLSGMNWRDSLSLGALMNTRGLMELIILNIGYDLGVLSPSVFTMMVVMAILTTFMTGPLLTLIQRKNIFKLQDSQKKKPVRKKFKITLTFGPSESGVSLLRMVSGLIDRKKREWIFALHLSPSTDSAIQSGGLSEREERIFSPTLALANELNVKVRPIFSISGDVQKDITKYAQQISPNFLFMGAARTVFGENVTGGKVGEVIRGLECGVGVFIDQGFNLPKKILVHYYSTENDALLEIAGRYYQKSGSDVTVLVESPDENFSKDNLKKYFGYSGKMKKSNPIHIVYNHILSSLYIQNFDLTLVDLEYWRVMKNLNSDWMKESNSSILLVRPPVSPSLQSKKASLQDTLG